MSNSLDPDQARRFVGPDLGPNCLPKLSEDDTGRQRVNFNTSEFSSEKEETEAVFSHAALFLTKCKANLR